MIDLMMTLIMIMKWWGKWGLKKREGEREYKKDAYFNNKYIVVEITHTFAQTLSRAIMLNDNENYIHQWMTLLSLSLQVRFKIFCHIYTHKKN